MLEIILIIIGFILLVKGSSALITGSEVLAKKLRVSELIIGLTIVSIGTSIPELFISISATVNNSQDLILGNVIGSNITNLLFIFGLLAIIKEISFKKESIKFGIPFMLLSTLLLYILCNIGNKVSRFDSIILLLMFSLFIFTIFKTTKEKNELKIKSNITGFKTFMYIIIGIVFLGLGSNLVVSNATILAELLNIQNSIISLSLIAIGTSLPELITYIIAIRKGDNNIAIGNIIGSNVLNIVFIVGISSLIKPISYDIFYNNQFYILFISIILLLIFTLAGKKYKMSKLDGFIYFILFIIYLVLLYI